MSDRVFAINYTGLHKPGDLDRYETHYYTATDKDALVRYLRTVPDFKVEGDLMWVQTRSRRDDGSDMGQMWAYPVRLDTDIVEISGPLAEMVKSLNYSPAPAKAFRADCGLLMAFTDETNDFHFIPLAA